MDALHAIMTRRSIRKYTLQPVAPETVRTLLEAAMAAPSAGNQQPWHFVVLDDRQLLDQIPTFHPFSTMIRQAPLAILVCGDTNREIHPGYWIQDCAAATQNLLVAGRALGLATVWLGVHPREERVKGLRQLLHLPDNVIPLALVPIGYSLEPCGPVERYEESRVHHNGW